jgi:hypothetical protein
VSITGPFGSSGGSAEGGVRGSSEGAVRGAPPAATSSWRRVTVMEGLGAGADSLPAGAARVNARV